MRHVRFRAACAAFALFCVSSSASAQLQATNSTDPSVLNGLPTPVIAKAKTGPGDSLKLSGDALSVSTAAFEFPNGAPVPFILLVTPEENTARVRFTVGTTVLEQVSQDAEAVFSADAIYLYAKSLIPEVTATADRIRLDVTTGSAGSTSKRARAVGGIKPHSLLSLTGVSLAEGFTLSGNLTFAAPYPISQVPASIEIRLVETGIDPTNDADLDGVADDKDNCPQDYNPSQANSDGDLLGDACDNCPFVTNPGQEDQDGDLIGEACDNCPFTCKPANGFTDCRNTNQKNSDGDPLGDVCDNCPTQLATPGDSDNPLVCVNGGPTNPPEMASEILCSSDAECIAQGFDACRQPDGDFDGQGDVCEAPGITGTLQAAPAQAGPTFSLTKTSEAETQFLLTIKCGNTDLSAANIPIILPPTNALDPASTAGFENCTQPQGAVEERIRSCLDSPALTNVNWAQSLTRGPWPTNSTPTDKNPSGVDNRFFLVSLAGNLPGGKLCLATDASSTNPDIRNRPLGTVSVTDVDLTLGYVPVIATDQLDFYEREASTDSDLPGPPVPGRCRLPETAGAPLASKLCTVVANADSPVATDVTTTRVVLNSGVNVELRPAVGEITTGVIKRWQLTVQSDQPIHTLAFGLRGFTGIDDNDAVFGGCDVGVTVQGLNVLACKPALFPNPDIGPTISADGDFFLDNPGFSFVPGAYVVPAHAQGAPSGLDPNAYYVVLNGALSGGALNAGNRRVLLGVFEYTPDPNDPTDLPRPSIVQAGVGQLLDPDDPDGNTPLPGSVVFTGDTPPGGIDGGSSGGTTTSSDGDAIDDDSDNCVAVANPDQADNGTVLALRSDDIGNVCQCGDGQIQNNGSIFDVDIDACIQSLGEGEVVTDNARRCVVYDDPNDQAPPVFDIEQVVRLSVALSAGGTCSDDPTTACFLNDDCPTGSCQGVTDKGVQVRQVCEQAGSTGG